MGLQWPEKDPGEVLDYTVDWSNVLVSGETLVSVVWTIVPVESGGLTKEADSIENLVEAVIVLSGGVAGTKYTVTCHITTSDGSPAREYERDIALKVRNL